MELTEEIRARRVAVAEDVLLQLGREDVPLRVRIGTSYMYMYGSGDLVVDIAGDLRDQADMVQGRCTVCAMGALLLSKARLTNEVPMADVVSSRPGSSKNRLSIYRDDICRLLRDTFDVDTLDRVEAFFEGFAASMAVEDYHRTGIAAYAKALPNPRDRMIELAENIAHNRGEFVVPVEYAEAGPASYDRPGAAEERANSRRSVRDRCNDAIADHVWTFLDRYDPAS